VEIAFRENRERICRRPAQTALLTRAACHISLCIYKWNAEIKTFLRAVKGPDNTSVDIKITHITGQALITDHRVVSV
jgi:hypothetical protein